MAREFANGLQVEADFAYFDAKEFAKVSGDQMVYLTSELNYKLRLPGAESRGVKVARNVYGEDGKPAAGFKKGETYMVELLLDLDKEVPYAPRARSRLRTDSLF
jgi:uncharacterized protein YfaS (alpha-2-macroglobulin family)